MATPGVPHTPVNPNILHPNKFVLSFAAIPTVEYWCQAVNIAGISSGEAFHPTPLIDLYSPGEKLIINPLAITFQVDEDLTGWMEVYTWMRAMTFPFSFEEYKALASRPGSFNKPLPQFSDATLIILDSKQNPHIRVKYYNCFPTSLTDIMFSAAAAPDEPITADAVFRFDFYDVEFTR